MIAAVIEIGNNVALVLSVLIVAVTWGVVTLRKTRE